MFLFLLLLGQLKTSKQTLMQSLPDTMKIVWYVTHQFLTMGFSLFSNSQRYNSSGPKNGHTIGKNNGHPPNPSSILTAYQLVDCSPKLYAKPWAACQVRFNLHEIGSHLFRYIRVFLFDVFREVQPFCYFRGRQRMSCDTKGNAGEYEGGLVLPRTKETRPQADPTSAGYASPLPTSLTQGDHPRREERPNALQGAPFLLHLPWHTGPAQQGTSQS